jgi:hypothetical protein
MTGGLRNTIHPYTCRSPGVFSEPCPIVAFGHLGHLDNRPAPLNNSPMDERLRSTAERALERALGHQRWRVDGEKVIVTFAFGGSLAINATAWEAGATTGFWPWTGSAILVLGAIATIALYMADRIREPEVTAILAKSRNEQWDADRTDLEFFRALYIRVTFNEKVLRTTYALTWVCVALAVLALVAGALAMLTLPPAGRS